MEIVGLFMAGWGSNNKYALLSAMRAVNQIISYDLPFIFSALVPVLLTGSLKLGDIAAAQQGEPVHWFIFYPVIGQLAFIMFVVSTLAAENRVPFDILEAESELVAGFRVEYSGMKFALIQLGEYAHMIGSSFLGALLFLGAWSGPGPEYLGPVWFLLKMVFMFLRRHLDPLELRPHPRGPDPGAVVEGTAAGDARAVGQHGGRCGVWRTVASNGVSAQWDRHHHDSGAVLHAMGATLRNLFRKPITVHYPDKPRRIRIAIAACSR